MKISGTVICVLALSLALLVEDSNAARQKKTKRNRRGRNRRRRQHIRTTQAPPKSCPPIPHIDNGQGLDTGNTVQYACEPGYVLEGTNVITCLHGRWTVAPRCKRQLCPLPPNVPFAAAPQLSNGGVTATYTCNAGYRIVGGNGATVSTVHCSTQTQFWPELPSCEEIRRANCAGPPSIMHAISTVSNNVATYICITGYKLRIASQNRIVCTAGHWSSVNHPVCVINPVVPPAEVKCLKAPPCGTNTINREAVGDSYKVGSSVRYTCITGYRIVGSNSNTNNSARVFCRSDGTWTVTPSCEPVVCGVPPAGTNTRPVDTSTISFPGMYTYACIDNYETSSSLVTNCLADGNWSLNPPPTCIAKTCKGSTLQTLPFAFFLRQDVPIGGTVTYTCQAGYRIAPAGAATATTQTVTCQANGTFTSLASTCVYTFPESCRDYFARDNLFAGAATTCVTVTIDPQGPDPANPLNPPAAMVQCCKDSATDFCTQVTPNSGTAASLTATACTAAASTILPTTTFTLASSAVCGTGATDIDYPIGNDQLLSMIRSSNGTCQQTTTVNCLGASNGNALALQVNSEPSGYIYGSSAFESRGGGNEMDLTHYTYADEDCDCATSGAAVSAGDPCENGCNCVDNGAVGAARTDTITKHLTTANPVFATGFQFTRHNIVASGTATPGANELTVSVGAIRCCEPF